MDTLTPEQRKIIGGAFKKMMQVEKITREYFKEVGSSSTIGRILSGRTGVEESKIHLMASLLDTSVDDILKQESSSNREWLLERLIELDHKIECGLDQESILKYLEELKKKWEVAFIYYMTGKIHFYQKRYKKSEQDYKRAVAICKTDRNECNALSLSLNGLSNIQFRWNNLENALEFIVEAIEGFDRNGYRKHYLCSLVMNKIVFLDDLHRIDEANQHIRKLWEKRKEIFKGFILVQVYQYWAKLLFRENSLHEALSVLSEGVHVALEHQLYDNLMDIKVLQSEIHLKKYNLFEAKEIVQFACELRPKLKDDCMAISAFVQLGKVFEAEKEFNLALEAFDQAVQIGTDNKYKGSRFVEAQIAKGDFLFRHSPVQAIPIYLEALELAKSQWIIEQQKYLLLQLSKCDQVMSIQYLLEYRDLS